MWTLYLKETVSIKLAGSKKGRMMLTKMSAVVKAEHDGISIRETKKMRQLRRQIDRNCGEYCVGGRGKWGKVLGHATEKGNWWWGRWELLCWVLGFSSREHPFALSE